MQLDATGPPFPVIDSARIQSPYFVHVSGFYSKGCRTPLCPVQGIWRKHGPSSPIWARGYKVPFSCTSYQFYNTWRIKGSPSYMPNLSSAKPGIWRIQGPLCFTRCLCRDKGSPSAMRGLPLPEDRSLCYTRYLEDTRSPLLYQLSGEYRDPLLYQVHEGYRAFLCYTKYLEDTGPLPLCYTR
jgi:hypothetical protein